MKFLAVNEQQNLVISTTEKPDITSDECLIKVKGIGVNRADILQKQGKYPPPKGESEILGLEVAGEIVDCGDRVASWQTGNKVFGLVPGGGYAEYVKVKANHLMPLPENLSFICGAATAEVFLTAYQSLFSIAKLQQGEAVLIHAGASGVGTAAIQLAKQKNCYVVATVGNEEKVEACLNLGADQVINYKKVDFVTWCKEHWPKGFDVILDVVAGDYLAQNINVAALDCRIVMLAMLGGRFTENVDCAKMLLKRVNLHASTLRNRDDDYKRQLVENFKSEFYQALVSGGIKPIIDSIYPWQQAGEAHQRMEANQNIGKLILTLDD